MRSSIIRSLSVVFIVFVFAVVSVLVMGASNQDRTQAANGLTTEPVSYRDVVKKVLPAVVSVEATSKQVSEGPALLRWRDEWRLPQEFHKLFEDFTPEANWPETIRHGMGSGFIVDPKGVVVTNNHVVKGATEVTVRLQDGRQFTATDIKSDPKTDLAVIRFDAKSNLPHLEFDDSSAMEIGDRVLAAGAPFGLAGSVSSGIISGKGRKFNSLVHEDFLQTDAAINPGNSGGPLVNLDGKVVGVNTAIRSNSGGSQGVGLAISSNVARDIVDRLIRDGAVQRGYLGVQVQRLDPEVGARLGVENKKGVVVARVMDGSPAAKASIQAGDVLLSVENHDISDPAHLQRRVMAIKPKSTVSAKVWRDRKMLELSITIEEQPNHTLVSGTLPARTSGR